MGGACGTFGGQESCTQDFGGETRGKESYYLEDSLRWKDIIKKDLQEVEWGGMDRIAVAQDRNRWRVIVNAVMNLPVSYNAGNFLTS